MPETEITQKVQEKFMACMPLFTAMGDPLRQKIVLALLEAGCDGLPVCDTARQVKASRPAVSYHLKLLKEAGVVCMRTKGTTNFYFVGEGSALEGLCGITQEIAALIREMRCPSAEA